jgi:hypothetical protein
LEEEVDEPTFYISSHARRSLAVQEAWRKVRDNKRKKRGEDEDAELDDGAGEGGDRWGLVLESVEGVAMTRRDQAGLVG